MIPKKKCGSCTHHGPHYCTSFRAYYDSDRSNPCKHWVGVKYNRAAQKKRDRFELKLEQREIDEPYLEYYDDDHEKWYWLDLLGRISARTNQHIVNRED